VLGAVPSGKETIECYGENIEKIYYRVFKSAIQKAIRDYPSCPFSNY